MGALFVLVVLVLPQGVAGLLGGRMKRQTPATTAQAAREVSDAR